MADVTKANLNRMLPQLVSPKQTDAMRLQKLKAGLHHPLPETWVGLDDALIRNIRRFKEEEPDTSYFILLKDKPPPPRESKFTVLGTAAEIFNIHRKNSPVRARLEEWMDTYRAQYALGKLDARVMAEKEALHSALLERYLSRVNESIEWYFNNFFRVFDDRTLEEIAEDKLAEERDDDD